MAAAKKAAAKKQGKKRQRKPVGKAPGTAAERFDELDAGREIRSMEQVDEIISRANEKAPQWAEAWRMQAMGVPSRVMGQRLGVSHSVALEWAANWVRLVDGDPDRVSDRAEIVARLDLAIEKQLAELTQLEAAEQRRKRRWDAQDREAGIPAELSEFQPVPVWLENSDGLLKALAAKQRVVAPHSPQKQVTVELAAAAGEGGAVMPGALAGVIARVTVTDNEEGAA